MLVAEYGQGQTEFGYDTQFGHTAGCPICLPKADISPNIRDVR